MTPPHCSLHTEVFTVQTPLCKSEHIMATTWNQDNAVISGADDENQWLGQCLHPSYTQTELISPNIVH